MIKLTELHKAIMSRDDCTEEQADVLVQELREMVREGEDPETVLYDEGFEPDYVFDILGF